MIGMREVRGAVSAARGRVRNFYQQRRLVELGIGQIQGQIASLQEQILAVEEGIKLAESPEFLWLTKSYLPARRRYKIEARCEIPPDDAIKQAMAQGQINELESQMGEIAELRSTLSTLQERLDIAREAESKWHQSRGGTHERN